MRRGLFALVLCGLLAGCTSVVRSGLSEDRASALLLALDDHAIAASVAKSGPRGSYEVRVPRGELAAALRIARDDGALGVAQPAFADVYAEPPLLPTPAEERARQAFATAGELARSIQALPDVRRARVHLTPPEPRPALDAARGAWRASMLVQRAAGTPPIDEGALRRLLHGAVAELAAADIAIVQSELAPAKRPEHARIGPFTVAKRDAPLLRATLAGALALNTLLGVTLIVVVARRRSRGEAA
jgi:type III secretory pathway lipoprotein EscJ